MPRVGVVTWAPGTNFSSKNPTSFLRHHIARGEAALAAGQKALATGETALAKGQTALAKGQVDVANKQWHKAIDHFGKVAKHFDGNPPATLSVAFKILYVKAHIGVGQASEGKGPLKNAMNNYTFVIDFLASCQNKPPALTDLLTTAQKLRNACQTKLDAAKRFYG
jgi:hypothetical protein